MRNPLRSALAFSALSAALLAGGFVHAADQPAGSGYQAAIASPIRTDDDRKTDAKRKPAEFLAFAEVRPGMKALDVASGGGSTASLLTAAVGPKGEVWAQNAKPNPKLQERVGGSTLPNLHAVVADYNDPVPKGTPPLDLITINMSYHDIANTPTDRAAMNKRLYEALKPGGLLVIIDNAAKKGAGLTAPRPCTASTKTPWSRKSPRPASSSMRAATTCTWRRIRASSLSSRWRRRTTSLLCGSRNSQPVVPGIARPDFPRRREPKSACVTLARTNSDPRLRGDDVRAYESGRLP